MLARTKVLWTVVCVAVLAVGLGPATAQATVWNAFEGWHSDTNTSSNLWQYMRAANDGVNGGYALLPNYYAAGAVVPYDAWWYGAPALPVVGNDGTQMVAHPAIPGSTSPDAVIAWKSPITGAVKATFSLTDLAPTTYTDGVDWYLFKSGVSTALSSGIVADGGSSGTVNVYNIEVSTGDMLYLQIGSGGQGHGDEDLTGVSFSLDTDAAPEPSALVLLTCGILSLLAYAWRKRK